MHQRIDSVTPIFMPLAFKPGLPSLKYLRPEVVLNTCPKANSPSNLEGLIHVPEHFRDGLLVSSAKTLAADDHSLFGKRLRPELDLECPGRQDPEPAKGRMGIMVKILSKIRT